MQSPSDAEKIRVKNFEESKLDAFQAKYGLFSFAGTLAIQPHSYDPLKPSRRDKDGAVKTSPRNICVSPTKSGKSPDVYFSIPGFLSTGDSYKPPNRSKISNHAVHDTPFKLPGPFELKSTFEHISELIPKKRTQSTVPRNFYTSPAKKGNPNCTPGVTFSEHEHIAVPPATKLKKLLNNSEKFKPPSQTPELFDKKIYQFEGVLPNKVLKKEAKMIEVPFKPSSPCKKNLPDALFGFNEYIPPRVETVKMRNRKAETPLPWKATTREFTTPTVPTATMACNLRKEFRGINY